MAYATVATLDQIILSMREAKVYQMKSLSLQLTKMQSEMNKNQSELKEEFKGLKDEIVKVKDFMKER